MKRTAGAKSAKPRTPKPTKLGVLTWNLDPRLLAIARHAIGTDTTQQEEPLQLVKDHGVYLMSTRTPGLPCDGSNAAYAIECDPQKVPFDSWWQYAENVLGGDDCVLKLPGAATMVSRAAELGGKTLTLTLYNDDTLTYSAK